MLQKKVTDTPDGDCNDAVSCDMPGKGQVSNSSKKGSNDIPTTKFSQRLHLEMNEKRQFGAGSVHKDCTHQDRESDSHSPHNIDEERSSFEFLERCLGLKDFSSSSRQKSSCGKEVHRVTDMEQAVPSDGKLLDQAEHENWVLRAGPPTLVPMDLETSFRNEVRGLHSASNDTEPPLLSVLLGGAVTNLKDSPISTLDEVEKDVGIRKNNLIPLMSPRHLKQSLHPVVLLKDSVRTKGYHCAECSMMAQMYLVFLNTIMLFTPGTISIYAIPVDVTSLTITLPHNISVTKKLTLKAY